MHFSYLNPVENLRVELNKSYRNELSELKMICGEKQINKYFSFKNVEKIKRLFIVSLKTIQTFLLFHEQFFIFID